MSRLKISVAAAVSIALIFMGWFLWSITHPHAVLQVQNYPNVRNGMQQVDVEALLGGPPGNYGANQGRCTMTEEGYLFPQGSVERIWSDDNNRLEIYFDRNGAVVGHHKRARYSQMPATGWFTRTTQAVRRFLRL